MKVLIANVNPGLVCSNYMNSVLNLIIADSQDRKIVGGYLPRISNALLDIHRNNLVEQFLAMETIDGGLYDYIWFVDSDISVQPDALYKLLDVSVENEYPVVSGIYPTLDNGVTKPTMWNLGAPPTSDPLPNIPTFNLFDTIPSDPVVTVDGVGAGCLLIHRSILEAMRLVYPKTKPWFDNGLLEDMRPLGEDFTFCLRVKQMGYEIHVVTDVRCEHEKLVKLRLPAKELV